MSTMPCIVICPQDKADHLSKVFEAMGRGPNSFVTGRKVCAKDPAATQSTPPTHRLIQDMSATAELEDMWRKMAAGEAMPQIIWSETGLVTESEAVASALSMTVFSVAGAEATNWGPEGILDQLGLQYVPEVEI
ncbi:MAG: hypothetical protein ABNH26_08825 [Celeribacter sp.]